MFMALAGSRGYAGREWLTSITPFGGIFQIIKRHGWDGQLLLEFSICSVKL
jgi:hypothetical protein